MCGIHVHSAPAYRELSVILAPGTRICMPSTSRQLQEPISGIGYFG